MCPELWVLGVEILLLLLGGLSLCFSALCAGAVPAVEVSSLVSLSFLWCLPIGCIFYAIVKAFELKNNTEKYLYAYA